MIHVRCAYGHEREMYNLVVPSNSGGGSEVASKGVGRCSFTVAAAIDDVFLVVVVVHRVF